MIIETTNNRKFGGFTTIPWKDGGDDKIGNYYYLLNFNNKY